MNLLAKLKAQNINKFMVVIDVDALSKQGRSGCWKKHLVKLVYAAAKAYHKNPKKEIFDNIQKVIQANYTDDEILEMASTLKTGHAPQ